VIITIPKKRKIPHTIGISTTNTRGFPPKKASFVDIIPDKFMRMRKTGINAIRNVKIAKIVKGSRRFIITPPSEVIEPPLEVEEILQRVLSL
jgi:hypothetical protein